MPDIADGETVEVQGSAAAPYELKNVGGVYSCSCPAWRNAGGPIDRRTCKHLKAYRGDEAEIARVGDAAKMGKPSTPKKAKSADGDDDEAGGDAPPVLLAHKWENDIDLVGWWMSEKLDGVRAWWDGTKFLSRLGNAFLAPAWFTKGLPDHPLDGELWVARKEFQKCVSIVRSAGAGEQWREVKYLVFDAPQFNGPFEARVEFVNKLFGDGQHEFATPVAHLRCEGYEHLKKELARVEGLGGEGLMLRQPTSKYISGRSTTLLKVKTFHDAEARVVAHEGGKGKHKGRLGALVVEMLDGTRFNVGTGFSDKEREDPPPIGAIITYRYQELTKDGVPRFPSYVGVAIDKDAPTVPPKPSLSTPVKPAAAAAAAAAGAKTAAAMAKSAPKPAPAPAAASDDDDEDNAPTTPPAKASTNMSGGEGGFRRFEMDEKFWAIKLHGSSHTVKFGKIGTNGTEKTKDFADAGAAKKEYDKLVAEKTKKGYEEVGGAGAAGAVGASDGDEAGDDEESAAAAPAAATPAAKASAPKAAPAPTAAKVEAKPALPSEQDVDDEKAVHDVVRKLSASWRNKQWSEIDDALDAECVFQKADGARVEGRAGCAQSYREFMERTRIIRYSESDHRVDAYVHTAVATCRWEMTYAAGGQPKREKGTETLVLAKIDGRWRVVWRRVDVIAPPAPPPPAPVQASADDDDDDEVAPDSDEGDAVDDDDDDDDDDDGDDDDE